MSAEIIGTITSPSNSKIYKVKWDAYNKDVYVSYAGWSYVGQAGSVSEAKNISISLLAQNS